MKIHEVKCDECKKKAPLKYNREHWLPPQGWVELYDDNLAQMVDVHLCPECKPKMRVEAMKKAQP